MSAQEVIEPIPYEVLENLDDLARLVPVMADKARTASPAIQRAFAHGLRLTSAKLREVADVMDREAGSVEASLETPP